MVRPATRSIKPQGRRAQGQGPDDPAEGSARVGPWSSGSSARSRCSTASARSRSPVPGCGAWSSGWHWMPAARCSVGRPRRRGAARGPPADPAGALQSLVSRLRRALGAGAQVQQSAAGYTLGPAASASTPTCSAGWCARRSGPRTRRRGHRPRPAARGPRAVARAGARRRRRGRVRQAPLARLDELRLAALGERIEADLAAGRAATWSPSSRSSPPSHPLRERFAGLLMRALAAAGRTAEALAGLRAAARDAGRRAGRRPVGRAAAAAPGGAARRGAGARGRAGARNLRAPRTLRRPRRGHRPGRSSCSARPAGHARRAGRRGQDPARHRGRPRGWPDRRTEGVAGRAGAGHRRRRRAGAPAGASALRETRVARTAHGTRPAATASTGWSTALAERRHAAGRSTTASTSIDAAAAARRRAARRAARELRVLATSREPLGIVGEALCPSPRCALPDGRRAATTALAYPSVQLLRRPGARPCGPDFAVTTRPSRRGRDLPAARRAAAGDRAGRRPAAHACRWPRSRPAGRPVPAAHRRQPHGAAAAPTLRAVVDWSWDLLTDGRADAGRAAGRVPGRRHRRRPPSGLRWRRTASRGRRSTCCRAGGQVAARRWSADGLPLPDAGDDPGVRPGAAGRAAARSAQARLRARRSTSRAGRDGRPATCARAEQLRVARAARTPSGTT